MQPSRKFKNISYAKWRDPALSTLKPTARASSGPVADGSDSFVFQFVVPNESQQPFKYSRKIVPQPPDEFELTEKPGSDSSPKDEDAQDADDSVSARENPQDEATCKPQVGVGTDEEEQGGHETQIEATGDPDKSETNSQQHDSADEELEEKFSDPPAAEETSTNQEKSDNSLSSEVAQEADSTSEEEPNDQLGPTAEEDKNLENPLAVEADGESESKDPISKAEVNLVPEDKSNVDGFQATKDQPVRDDANEIVNEDAGKEDVTSKSGLESALVDLDENKASPVTDNFEEAEGGSGDGSEDSSSAKKISFAPEVNEGKPRKSKKKSNKLGDGSKPPKPKTKREARLRRVMQSQVQVGDDPTNQEAIPLANTTEESSSALARQENIASAAIEVSENHKEAEIITDAPDSQPSKNDTDQVGTKLSGQNDTGASKDENSDDPGAAIRAEGKTVPEDESDETKTIEQQLEDTPTANKPHLRLDSVQVETENEVDSKEKAESDAMAEDRASVERLPGSFPVVSIDSESDTSMESKVSPEANEEAALNEAEVADTTGLEKTNEALDEQQENHNAPEQDAENVIEEVSTADVSEPAEEAGLKGIANNEADTAQPVDGLVEDATVEDSNEEVSTVATGIDNVSFESSTVNEGEPKPETSESTTEIKESHADEGVLHNEEETNATFAVNTTDNPEQFQENKSDETDVVEGGQGEPSVEETVAVEGAAEIPSPADDGQAAQSAASKEAIEETPGSGATLPSDQTLVEKDLLSNEAEEPPPSPTFSKRSPVGSREHARPDYWVRPAAKSRKFKIKEEEQDGPKTASKPELAALPMQGTNALFNRGLVRHRRNSEGNKEDRTVEWARQMRRTATQAAEEEERRARKESKRAAQVREEMKLTQEANERRAEQAKRRQERREEIDRLMAGAKDGAGPESPRSHRRRRSSLGDVPDNQEKKNASKAEDESRRHNRHRHRHRHHDDFKTTEEREPHRKHSPNKETRKNRREKSPNERDPGSFKGNRRRPSEEDRKKAKRRNSATEIPIKTLWSDVRRAFTFS